MGRVIIRPGSTASEGAVAYTYRRDETFDGSLDTELRLGEQSIASST